MPFVNLKWVHSTHSHLGLKYLYFAFSVDMTSACANIGVQNYPLERVWKMKNRKSYFHCKHVFFILFILPALQIQPTATASNGYGIKEENMAEQRGLTEAEGKYLLKEARKTIQASIAGKKETAPKEAGLPEPFNEQRGTFVTLTIQGNLRGLHRTHHSTGIPY